jgi:hypothetical protein
VVEYQPGAFLRCSQRKPLRVGAGQRWADCAIPDFAVQATVDDVPQYLDGVDTVRALNMGHLLGVTHFSRLMSSSQQTATRCIGRVYLLCFYVHVAERTPESIDTQNL